MNVCIQWNNFDWLVPSFFSPPFILSSLLFSSLSFLESKTLRYATGCIWGMTNKYTQLSWYPLPFTEQLIKLNWWAFQFRTHYEFGFEIQSEKRRIIEPRNFISCIAAKNSYEQTTIKDICTMNESKNYFARYIYIYNDECSIKTILKTQTFQN